MFDLALKLRGFAISGVADRISCPTLITMSEGDPQSAQAKRLYSVLCCPKHLVHFTAAEAAAGHCESLSRSLYHQRVFDWLDDTLRISSEFSPLGTLSLPATGKEEVYAYKSTSLSGE